MTLRQVVVGSSVIILMVANVTYWWPDDSGQGVLKDSAITVHTETLNLDAMHAIEYLPSEVSKVKRDLFFSVATAVVEKAPKKEIKPVLLETKRPETLSKNNVMPRDHLIGYQLAGVVIRNGEYLAYLLDGKTPLVARVGDSLNQSVTVESIDEQTATLRDVTSGLTKKLMLAVE